MWRLLVLSLSASCGLCLTVTPDMLVPMKEYNEACGYDACSIPLSEDGINVHIVPYTHYELGFERTFDEHYTGNDPEWAHSNVNMKQTLDSVITELWMKANRRFALANIPYLFHWWSQRDDTVRQMVYTLIRQGRLVLIGGGWSMADEATTNYHAIIDSHTFSLRKINATFWECGRPLVAWQADVMGHSREFASLAAQMGYDALFINPISFDDELQRMQRWALEMLWRGSDDLGPKSDIFTHKLFDGYWSPPGFCFSSLCQDPLIVTSDLAFNNVEERAQTFVDVIYNRQAPNYNTSHVMVMMGHVNGYFDAPMWFANIDALINAVNARSTTGKQKMYVFYSTPACYAKAVHESNITLETKQDDFFPMAYDKTSYLTGFYTSCPSIKYMARIAMVYLQMCKQMKVLAEIGPEYNKLFEELNWIVGAFQDHSIITGALRDHVKSYYIEKHYTAVQRSTILLREAWNKLRKCPTETKYYRCSLNISQCHFLIGDSFFVQIYNPLGWAVTMPVRVPMWCFQYGFQVLDPKGQLVKSATMIIPYPVLNMPSRWNTSNCEVVFIAKDLPPMGFRSYFIQRIMPDQDRPVFKRESDNVTIDDQDIIDNTNENREAIDTEKVVGDESVNKNEIPEAIYTKKVMPKTIKRLVKRQVKNKKKDEAEKIKKKKVQLDMIAKLETPEIRNDKHQFMDEKQTVPRVKDNEKIKLQHTIEKKKSILKTPEKRNVKHHKQAKLEDIDKGMVKQVPEQAMVKQDIEVKKNVKLEMPKLGNVKEILFYEKEEAINKRELKSEANDNEMNEHIERPKLTLIKQLHSTPIDVNQKPKKKFLIRKTHAQFDDFLPPLYEMDYDDYPIRDAKPDQENVTVLLESDKDELEMKEIIGRDDFPFTRKTEVPGVVTRKTVAPELVKTFPSGKMTKITSSDVKESDVKPQHWKKVILTGNKGLDDKLMISNMQPETTDKTSTLKYTDELSENSAKFLEDFPRGTVAPEHLKSFTSGTRIVPFIDEMEPQQWKKVIMSGNGRLDDKLMMISNMQPETPDKTSTVKYTAELSENTTKLLEDSPRGTIAPEHIKHFTSRTTTVPFVDKVEPQHWKKVIMTGNKKLDDKLLIISNMQPEIPTAHFFKDFSGGNVAPEHLKSFTPGTRIVPFIDEMEPQHWKKVIMSGNEGLDDKLMIISNMQPDTPDKTSTEKNTDKLSENTTKFLEDFPRGTVTPEVVKSQTHPSVTMKTVLDVDEESDFESEDRKKAVMSRKKGLDDIISNTRPDTPNNTSTEKYTDKLPEITTTTLEDFPRKTVAPEDVKTSSRTSTVPFIDEMEPQHWEKVPMSGKKDLDDIIAVVHPGILNRSSTVVNTGESPETTTNTLEDVPRKTLAPDPFKPLIDIEVPRQWNKEVISEKNDLDDMIADIHPDITCSAKYPDETQEKSTKKLQQNFTETRRKGTWNQSGKNEMEQNTTVEEDMHDLAETLTEPDKEDEEEMKITTEGESSEEIDVTEASIKGAAAPMRTTTFKNTRTTTTETTKTTSEIGIKEKRRKQYQVDTEQEPERRTFNVSNVNNTYIENKYIRVTIDPVSSKVSTVTLSNGVEVKLDIQFYFYVSDDPIMSAKTGFKQPGAFLFRALENTLIPVLDFIDVQVFKTEVVQEAHLVYSDWTSLVLRVYHDSPVIELEWLVGPVPTADKLGKEVFIRYLTNLVHDGVFYTDSNGRQNIKRIRNLRPQFEPMNIDQIAGNFYPVTSRISIEDLTDRVCFSVFTDRAQGGTSLADGEIDLMLQRRVFTDDTGLGTSVNDNEWGEGVVVRGKHYLYFSKMDHKPYRIFEKKFAKEIQMGPQILISRPDPYGGGTKAKDIWFKSVNELSFLKTKLPIGVHILTLEYWNDETLLLRLENYLEKSDSRRNHVKTVFIKQLFTNIVITSVKETTLGANVWLKDHKPRKWNKNENFLKSFNEFYAADKTPEFLDDEKPVTSSSEWVLDLDKGITLGPQEIRTFVCWFEFVDV